MSTSTPSPAASPPIASAAVALEHVDKVHPGGVRALRDVSLTVPVGSFLAVVGPSGSGKSTLMHCAAGLDLPTRGQVRIEGRDVTRMSEARRTELRRERVGFVFQAYNLIASLTVRQNIELPLRLAGAVPDARRVDELAASVGLSDRLEHLPAELSGGQQQRAAIARALVARPAVLFADEPTGALDLAAAAGVLGLLRELVDQWGQTVVVVTHDPSVAARADRVAVMADGEVRELLDAPTAPALARHLLALGQR